MGFDPRALIGQETKEERRQRRARRGQDAEAAAARQDLLDEDEESKKRRRFSASKANPFGKLGNVLTSGNKLLGN